MAVGHAWEAHDPQSDGAPVRPGDAVTVSLAAARAGVLRARRGRVLVLWHTVVGVCGDGRRLFRHGEPRAELRHAVYGSRPGWNRRSDARRDGVRPLWRLPIRIFRRR